MDTATHTDYMLAALKLAERGRYTVSPNPMVGCVIVSGNRIVGQGYHQRAGEPHAEVHALQAAGSASKGGIAYVTLEPCCHIGKTPPCTDALIQAGIKTVYVACQDPNPMVAGKGLAALRQSGIEVHVGLCEAEAQLLNEIFFKYITQRRPFVIAKWAMSLDGKTITHPGDSRKISGVASQQHTHATRQAVDAILVGANTVRCDDPELTARTSHAEIAKQPLRIILDSQASLSQTFKVLNGSLPGKTLLATTEPVTCHNDNVEILISPKNAAGHVDLPSLLDELGRRGITSILVEGGMTVHDSFFKANLVDRVQVYVAPVFIGTLANKVKIPNVVINNLDNDILFDAAYQESANV